MGHCPPPSPTPGRTHTQLDTPTPPPPNTNPFPVTFPPQIHADARTRISTTLHRPSAPSDVECTDTVFPVTYPRFAEMVEEGDNVYMGRYLVSGADSASLYLEVRMCVAYVLQIVVCVCVCCLCDSLALLWHLAPPPQHAKSYAPPPCTRPNNHPLPAPLPTYAPTPRSWRSTAATWCAWPRTTPCWTAC